MIAEPPLDAPDEDWLVWADAMQQIGDPRGELLALGHPEAYIAKHADALLGGSLARHLRKDEIRISRWRRCYSDEIELRISHVDEAPKLAGNVFNAPIAARMRSLVVAGVPPSIEEGARPVDLASTIEWLTRRDLCPLPPQLRALSLVDDRARSVDHLISRDWQPSDSAITTAHLEVLAAGLEPRWRGSSTSLPIRIVGTPLDAPKYRYIVTRE